MKTNLTQFYTLSASLSRGMCVINPDAPADPQATRQAELASILATPWGRAMQAILRAGLQRGLPLSTIDTAIDQMIAFFRADSQRCSACLRWIKTGPLLLSVKDEQMIPFLVCPSCNERVQQRKATASMKRNLRAYAGVTI